MPNFSTEGRPAAARALTSLDEKISYYAANHGTFRVPVGEPDNDGSALGGFFIALRSLAEKDEPVADLFGED